MVVSSLHSTYEFVEVIEEGSFGKVYKAINQKTGHVVAIKCLKQRYSRLSFEDCLNTISEIKIQKVFGIHRNIIHLRHVFQQSGYLHMVFDFMESNLCQVIGGRIRTGTDFHESQISHFLFLLLQGLEHIHASGYMHRDLKPENVLATGNQLKISDFGSAAEINMCAQYTNHVTTRWYRAPEICVGQVKYDAAVDMWALGTIMAEMYLLEPLFSGGNKDGQFVTISNIMGTPSQEDWDLGHREAVTRGLHFQGEDLSQYIPKASECAIDLMYKLLSWNPKKRITAKEALKHPFFKDCFKTHPISTPRCPPGFPAYPQVNASLEFPPLSYAKSFAPRGFPTLSYSKAFSRSGFPAYTKVNVAPVFRRDFLPLPCAKVIAPPGFKALSYPKYVAVWMSHFTGIIA